MQTSNVSHFSLSRLIIAFFLGALVGFPLYSRTQQPPQYIVVFPPQALSLWGIWEIPGALLIISMLIQIVRSLADEAKEGLRWWKMLKSALVLLLACALVIWGTVPLPTINLNAAWTWNDSFALGGGLVTPLVVGFITSFAAGGSANEWLFSGTIAWLGATVALILLTVISAQFTIYIQGTIHLWIMHPENVLFTTAVFWIPASFILATMGASIGRLLFTLALA